MTLDNRHTSNPELTPDMAMAYRDALQVQDACNLCAVLHSWAEHAKTVIHSPGPGGQNFHPVNVLFGDKVADLLGFGRDTSREFGAAFDAAIEALNRAGEPLPVCCGEQLCPNP